MADVLLAWDGHHVIAHPTLESLDGQLGTDGAFAWIDLERADVESLHRLAETFDLHRLAVESAQLEGERPQLTVFEDSYFLEFYALLHDGAETRVSEISLFLGRHYVISVRSDELPELARARERLTDFRRHKGFLSPSMVLYVMLDELVDAWFPFVEALGDQVDDLDERLLAGNETELYRSIHDVRRQLMQFWRILGPQREVLGTLARRDSALIDEHVAIYIADVHDHLLRVMDWLDTYRDALTTLHDVQLSVASNQLNRVMQTLTASSIILMTATLIAGVYGMNFERMPELGWAFGYPLALALMGLSSGLLFVYFRKRGWL